jgi:histidyl-tRNA synthetase
MDELNLFPNNITQGVTVLLVPRDAAVEDYAFGLTQQLRQAGISAEIFLGNVKKQKHFTYAETKNIKYMIEVGANEKESGNLRLRNVTERKEEGNGFTIEQLVPYLV